MKKIMLIMLSIMILGCSSDSDLNLDSESSQNKSSLSTNKINLNLENLGGFHNSAMTYLKDNFDFDQRNDSLINFNDHYFELSLDKNYNVLEGEDLHPMLDDDQYLHKAIIREKDNFNPAEIDLTYEYNAFEKTEILFEKEIISIYDKNYILELLSLHKQHYLLEIDDQELVNSIYVIKEEYIADATSLNTTEVGVSITTGMIGISEASNIWWNENLPIGIRGGNENVTHVAPWIIADVVGALGSGFINIIEQGIKGKGGAGEPADVEEVIYSMVKGGVISSVAPWSKIAKLF